MIKDVLIKANNRMDANEKLKLIIHDNEQFIKRVDYNRRFIETKTGIKIWVLTLYELRTWEKGRTYLYGDKVYHSGYPTGDAVENLRINMQRYH